jgi:signal peptidase I
VTTVDPAETAPPEDLPAEAEPALPEATPPDEPTARRRARGCLVEIVQTLIATLAIFFVIQTFVVQPFQVQQHSMETTFLDGDYLIVDRLSHLWSPYARGQVIVFRPPGNFLDGGKPLIKRVIGVGGDTVEIRDGAVFVNGTRLDEPYVHRDENGVQDETEEGSGGSSWLVPAGELFVLGDHREVSSDGRVFGPIPESSVIGRAFLRYWPFDRFGIT